MRMLAALFLLVALLVAQAVPAGAQTPGLDAFRQQLDAVAIQELPKTFAGLTPYEKGLALEALEARLDEADAAGDDRTYNALNFFLGFLPVDAIRDAAQEAASQPSASVHGVVTVAGTRQPVAGATVAYSGYRATTANDGAFRLEGLPPGEKTITVTASDRFEPAQAQVFLLPDQPQELNFALAEVAGAAFGRIAGIVLDGDTGEPMKNTVIQLIGAGDNALAGTTAKTDEAGRFEFEDVAEGSAKLVLNPFLQGADYYAANGNRLFAALEVAVEVPRGQTATPRIELATMGPKRQERTATVKGTVTDLVTGAPIEGVAIFVGRQSARTGDDGTYRVRQISPGKRILIAEHPAYLEHRRELGEIGPGIQTADIQMQPAGTGNLAGTVLAADTGRPLAGATIMAGGQTATAGQDGAFRLLGLKVGEIALTASAAGYQAATINVPLAEGETVSRTVTLEPITTGRVVGIVRDAETGRPLPDVLVLVGPRRIVTGADGGFDATDVPRGPILLTAALEGYKDAETRIEVVAAETAQVEIALEPITTGNLSLFVLDDETGRPVGGATVVVDGREDTSDASGQVRLEALPAGPMAVLARKDGYRAASAQVDIPRAGDVRHELRLPPILTGTVAGQVVNAADASPIAGANVSVGDRIVATDEGGRFNIPDLPAGRIRLDVSAPLFEPGQAGLDLARNETAEVVIELAPVTWGTVAGKVTDAATGRALPGARVQAGGRDVVADDAGAFEIARVDAGAVIVRASRRGYVPASAEGILKPGDTLQIALTLEPITHGAVTGRVIDAVTGQGLSGAEVRIGDAETRADKDGRFAFDRIGVGDVAAGAAMAGYLPGATQGRLEPGEALDLVIALEPIPRGTLTGRLVDAQTGEPVAGALVTLGDQTAETDENGVYRFQNARAGNAEIRVRFPGYRETLRTAEVPAGAQGQMDLALSVRKETAQEIASALSADGRIDLYGIYFDVNQDQFTPDSLPTLQALKAFLAAHPDTAFVLEGHTDSDGSEAFNQDLSERRAATVLNWLAENGVDTGNITAVGMGETAPVASNATRAGKALNRRVVLRRAGG